MPTRRCETCKEKIVIKQSEWKYQHGAVGMYCSKECLAEQIRAFATIDSGYSELDYMPSPINGMKISHYESYSKSMNISFRSDFEKRVARFLRDQEFDFLYEPYCFEFETFSYTPDFYVKPPYNCLIEVKGVFGVGGKKKLSLFLEYYPNINFIFIPWTMRSQF
jgi:hypothetical protein